MITYHVGDAAKPTKPVQLTLFSYGKLYGCKEVWKSADEVLGIAGYTVSSEGRVKGRSGKILSQETTDSYNKCTYKDGHRMTRCFHTHRLVATLFCPQPEGMKVVHHKDGDKRNNAADNLEWTTQSENLKHYYANK